MPVGSRKLEKVERENYLKDVIYARIREQNIEIALQTIPVSYCHTITNTELIKTRHGVVKKIHTVNI